MGTVTTVASVALVGFLTTSAALIGATLGLYVQLSKEVLACILAYAAGVLVAALGIELAFHGAVGLHMGGYSVAGAWALIGGGFAVGATVYYTASRFLDMRGAAVRSVVRVREYAILRKQEEAKELIQLLSQCDILRHLPPEAIAELLTHVKKRHLPAGEILFRAGDPGDALYIVAAGKVTVLATPTTGAGEREIAELGAGKTFGEMALLGNEPRTATIRAAEETELLEIAKEDFVELLAHDPQLAAAVRRLSHSRAISNLTVGGVHPTRWAKVAANSLDQLSRREVEKILSETGHSAGIAIVLGDLLDTIPGLLVIGAKFSGLSTLSVTLVMGIFVSGIPESAASAALLRRAGFSVPAIYGFWSISIVAGMIAAIVGNLFMNDPNSLLAFIVEAMAGGSLLAMVTHAMIPEALHQGGSLIVLPTVAGFITGLYVILMQSLV